MGVMTGSWKTMAVPLNAMGTAMRAQERGNRFYTHRHCPPHTSAARCCCTVMRNVRVLVDLPACRPPNMRCAYLSAIPACTLKSCQAKHLMRLAFCFDIADMFATPLRLFLRTETIITRTSPTLIIPTKKTTATPCTIWVLAGRLHVPWRVPGPPLGMKTCSPVNVTSTVSRPEPPARTTQAPPS